MVRFEKGSGAGRLWVKGRAVVRRTLGGIMVNGDCHLRRAGVEVYDPTMARRHETTGHLRALWLPLLAVVGVLLVAWGLTWRGLQLGVIDRGVLELWVHGRQPGWLDWVPFIHPPGYSLYMNSVESVSGVLGVEPESLVFWLGALVTVAAVVVATRVASRWFGPGPAVFVAAMTALSPQNLRPFEHYPVARLLLLVAFVLVADRLASPAEDRERAAELPLWLVAAGCLLAVELHLSSWFVLGPALGLLALRPVDGRAARLVLGALLGAFLLTTLFGLWEVLEFGVGHKPGRGAVSLEWANPALLIALVPALLMGPMRSMTAGLLAFCGITFALQALQVADGTPFPSSLHYFELVGMPAILVVAASLARLAKEAPRWLPTLLALVLLGTQVALFGRGLVALFVQPRWILMLF